ncbi:hypothetical protein LptCag_2130 [Leptospirillum ferriphilum]|uniref:Uncharacterized protein n=1 Tax=Leptospirillum ferriphilum TaxID=178606 RepID=A0A094WDW1_9BACT|nr:hypothetical protein LptCag_2130 [Leptospirillum ferriphilum]
MQFPEMFNRDHSSFCLFSRTGLFHILLHPVLTGLLGLSYID